MQTMHMRGLDARVSIARSRIVAITDKEAAEDLFVDSMFKAQSDGYRDYQAGRFDPPHLFLDERELTVAWHDGQRAAELGEIGLNEVDGDLPDNCNDDDMPTDFDEEPTPGSDWRGSR